MSRSRLIEKHAVEILREIDLSMEKLPELIKTAAILMAVGRGTYSSTHDATDQMRSIVDRNEPTEETGKRHN